MAKLNIAFYLTVDGDVVNISRIQNAFILCYGKHVIYTEEDIDKAILFGQLNGIKRKLKWNEALEWCLNNGNKYEAIMVYHSTFDVSLTASKAVIERLLAERKKE